MKKTKKTWWAVGIFKNENNDVYPYSVEITKFMSGIDIQKLLMTSHNKYYDKYYDSLFFQRTLELVFLIHDYCTPMQWRTTDPPIIFKNKSGNQILCGDGQGISKSTFEKHIKNAKRPKKKSR